MRAQRRARDGWGETAISRPLPVPLYGLGGWMVRVARVLPESIAEELGIVPGTELQTVNGRELGDFLDWEFLTADDELVIEARLPDGEAVVYEVERPDGESFGRELEPPTVRRCANRCEVCCVGGLPTALLRTN